MKKNMNYTAENNKQTPRFKIIDAVIILLIITAVLGIYFRFNLLDVLTNKKDMQDYMVSFSIEDIRYTTPNYINVGDRVYDANTGNELGSFVAESDDMSNIALRVTPASKFFTKDDGTVEEIFYPNNESRVDATGRMMCRGTYTQESGFLINGSTHLSSGQVISVRTELVSVSLLITNIEVFDQ